MSADHPETNLATSVLLPSAHVAVFSQDGDTLLAAEKMQDDWRFARIHSHVHKGDVETAIETYAEASSPDLIIVQTDVMGDVFIERLGVLAGHCSEGTAAIVVGPDNDVNLYRRLIDMGISDYLVRPLDAQGLSEVIAKTLIEKLGVSASRLIAFVGGKGGVGVSSLAQAMAWGVSSILEQKTLYLDISAGWSVASVGMGFEPVTTLPEAVGAAENNDDDSLDRMIFKASDKLSVLANGAEIMLEPGVSGGEIEHLIDFAMGRYPAVIVDLSHAAPQLMYTILNKAQHIVVVSSPGVSSLRLSRSLLQEIKNLRGDQEEGIDFVVNQVSAASSLNIPAKDIEGAMGVKPSASVPYLPDLFSAYETSDKPFLSLKGADDLLRGVLLPLLHNTFSFDASVLKGGSKDQSGGALGGFLSKFKSDS